MCVCACVHAHACHSLPVEVKGQLEGVDFLFSPWLLARGSYSLSHRASP